MYAKEEVKRQCFKQYFECFMNVSKKYFEHQRDKEQDMIEDVIRKAEEAILQGNLQEALIARKLFVYISREEEEDSEHFKKKYLEICDGIDKMISADEQKQKAKERKGIVKSV